MCGVRKLVFLPYTYVGIWFLLCATFIETCDPFPKIRHLKVECRLNGYLVDCSEATEGTVATFKCDKMYEPDTDRTTNGLICIGGSWNSAPPKCIPICGKRRPKAETLILEGNNATEGDWPWHTGLYKGAEKSFVCGGSLISMRIIVSAAHCVTNDEGDVHPTSLFTVAVGKYYREFTDDRDKHNQSSALKAIYVPSDYKGDNQNYIADIAVLVTDKVFDLTLHVQPVCHDWNGISDGEILSNPNIKGVVVGWGNTVEFGNPSEVLKELMLPYVPNDQCKMALPLDFDVYLTGDKMCAGYLNQGKGVCKGDSGGGLVFRHHTGRYYIRAIVSVSPKSPNGTCDSRYYGLFTRLNRYNSFIHEKELLSGSCVLPDYPNNGQWSVVGTDINYYPGDVVAPMTVLNVSCHFRHIVETPYIVCQDGRWLQTPKCINTCAPFSKIPHSKVECRLNGNLLDCLKATEGTLATFICDTFYELDRDRKATSPMCLDGSWNSAPPKCIPIDTQFNNSSLAFKEGCVLPDFPNNGQWVVLGANVKYNPGDAVAPRTILNVSCQYPHIAETPYIVCQDGRWLQTPKCIKTCTPFSKIPHLTVECHLNGHLVTCSKVTDGTVATFKCDPYYEPDTERTATSRICIHGSWDSIPPKCIPVCGKRSPRAETLNLEGNNATENVWPWHTALYKGAEKSFVCGGSLISTRVIVSAAHCVTNEAGDVRPTSLFTVAVGKYYREFNDYRDKQKQSSALKAIYVPNNYKGMYQNYFADIAVLVTEETFILTVRIQPVCHDWNGIGDDEILSNPNMKGIVVGWGNTDGKPSEVLRELRLPYVPNDQCRMAMPPNFLTADKMCAGYLDEGKAVCNGDSGGGLVFKRYDRYYIRAVVSVAPKSPNRNCDSGYYGLFTRLKRYNSFIYQKERLSQLEI